MMFKSICFMIILHLVSIGTAYDRIKAHDYAMAHCENPNKDSYPYVDSNDCTNFASQVLEQGGISQTDDWYCRKASGNPCRWPSIFRDYFCEDGYKFKKSWSVVEDLHN